MTIDPAALRQLRERHGLTQQALAARAGLAQSFVSQIEAGKREPSRIVVSALAAALGVETSELAARLPVRCPHCGKSLTVILVAELGSD